MPRPTPPSYRAIVADKGAIIIVTKIDNVVASYRTINTDGTEELSTVPLAARRPGSAASNHYRPREIDAIKFLLEKTESDARLSGLEVDALRLKLTLEEEALSKSKSDIATLTKYIKERRF